MNKKINNKIDHILILKEENRVMMQPEVCLKIEYELNIKLSKDFITLNNYHRYDYLDNFEWYSFDYGVPAETKSLRSACGLPHNYLILADDSPGPTLMKIVDDQTSEVILCSDYDFDCICKDKDFEENPIIFSSFTDFYEYLLDEEEKRLKEEMALEGEDL